MTEEQKQMAIKLVKNIMREQNTNLLHATSQAMGLMSEAADDIRKEYEETGRIVA